MSIRVTCVGCHTRFNVSEKFAGKEGPCPKCKKPILIPAVDEAVTVHAPKEFGPTGTSGTGVLKPVFRTDTKLSPVQWVLIAATIVGLFALAFLIRMGTSDKDAFNSIVLLVAGIAVAVPCVYAGYSFLRDSELGGHLGQELWTRVMGCSVAFGLSWLAIAAISYATGPEVGKFIGVALMFAIGAFAAHLLLGLDFFMSILHFGMYFGVAVLLRVVAGFSALPHVSGGGQNDKTEDMLNAAALSLQWFFA